MVEINHTYIHISSILTTVGRTGVVVAAVKTAEAVVETAETTVEASVETAPPQEPETQQEEVAVGGQCLVGDYASTVV